MTERPAALRFVIWLVIAVLSVYLTLIGGTYLGIETQVWRTASTVIAGGVLGIWLGLAFTFPSLRPGSVLGAAIAACLGAFLLSSALSWDPKVSFEMTGYAVLLTGLYLLTVRLMADDFFQPRFGALAFALCATICVAYLALVLKDWLDWWGLVGRLAVPPLRPGYGGLTFQTPNVVATVTVLLFAVAAAHLGWGSRGRRSALLGLGLAVASVVIITASRGAWGGVAAGVAALFLVWLADSGHRAAVRERLRDRRVALAAGGTAVGLVVLAVALAPRVLSRFTAGGEDLRLGFISVALRMFAERPLTGSGPGTWVIRRAAFTEPGQTDLYIPHAHDIYAQTLAELGLLGVAAGALLLGGLAWLVWGAIRDTQRLRRRFGWATLFALAFLGVQQLVDSFVNLPAVLFPLAVLIATLDATAERPFLADRLQPFRLRLTSLTGRALSPAGPFLLLIVLTGLSLSWLASSESAAARGQDAVTSLAAGDPAGALQAAEEATAADPTIGAYQLTVGLAADATGPGGDARAAQAFQAAAERDQLAESWLDLAALRAAAGDRPGAATALDLAQRLGVQRASVALPAGAVWLQLGEIQRAQDAFAAAIALAPSIAADPYWSSSAELAAVGPNAIRQAMDTGSRFVAWEIALVSGDRSEPTRRAALPPPGPELASLVSAAWAGDQGARDALVTRAVAEPLDPFTVGWSARLAARAGDDDAARRFRRWLLTVDPALTLGSAFDRTIDPTAQRGASPADNAAAAYGPATYRRATPSDLILARLPHLVLGR